MTSYRVRVDVWVAVEARNQAQAKAKAEQAVRLAVATAYREDIAGSAFSDGWELYGFRALGKPEAVRDDE